MIAKNLRFFILTFLCIVMSQRIFPQPEAGQKSPDPKAIPLFSRLHTLSIHVQDTVTQDSVFRFLADKLKLPVYYNPVKYGNRKYAGVYAGNLVLEPCGPYSNFSYASKDFEAIFFGLTFEPSKSIALSADGLTDRKVNYESGDSYIYIKDPVICGDNITISFMDKGTGKAEDKRITDSLLTEMTKDALDEPGIEYVKEILIGYKDNYNLTKWKELISPDKLINNKIWDKNDLPEFHFSKSGIKEVQSITFKVKSLERARQYLLRNNLYGDFINNRIILNKTKTFGLQICLYE